MSISTTNSGITTTLTPTSTYTADPEVATPVIETSIATAPVSVSDASNAANTPRVHALSNNFLVFVLFILFITMIYVLSVMNKCMLNERLNAPVMPVG